MIDKRIIDFLLRAKRTTYAGKGAETNSSRPMSHDLQYSEDKYLYYDTYLGGSRFSGEEAIWIDSTPYWSMNYTGRVTGENFSGDFLKKALLNVYEDMPFRGPSVFNDGKYTYKCVVDGDFEWFQGKETILFNSEEIYECFFHGGIIE